MSNVLLAAIGMVVTMISFGAFSIVQLAKAEARYGAEPGADASVPSGAPEASGEYPRAA